MLPEEGELENGMVQLGFMKIPMVVWSLSSYMNLDRKHFILPLLGLLAVLVDGLEGPCRV